MSRLIKFRAWHKEKNIMLSLNDSVFSDNKIWYLNTLECDAVFDVMQFTGLKDKNRREIYEGDIVKRESVNRSAGGDGIYFVKWNDGYSMLGICDKYGFPTDYHNRFYKIIPKKIEVIGNIYENPELLRTD